MSYGQYNQPANPQQGYPQWPPQPRPPQAPPAQPPAEKKKPGCLIAGIWLALAAVVTLIALVYVGFAAYNSESGGVMATQIMSLPFGFVWGGVLAAIIIQFGFKKAGTGIRVGGPIGCGCLGGLVFLLLVFIFFTGIFPSL
jgi:hypothetical protein